MFWGIVAYLWPKRAIKYLTKDTCKIEEVPTPEESGSFTGSCDELHYKKNNLVEEYTFEI